MKRIIEAFQITVIFSAVWVLTGLLAVNEGFSEATSELTRTHSGGGVTVRVTYLNPQGTDGPRFQVVLDTHSVNLDAYDLKGLSVLRDETGKTYQATAVENKGSGHHREVTLSFSKLTQETKRVALVIKDIAGAKERTFRWDLQ